MTLGEVVAALGEHLRTLWPFYVIDEWERGVKLHLGEVHSILGPGLHVVWPFVQDVMTEDCNTQVVETDEQVLTTADGETVVLAWTLRYRIRNVALYYQQINDAEDTILNSLQASAGRWVPEMNWEPHEEDEDDYTFATAIVGNVEGDVTERFEQWGIEVEDLAPHTLARAQGIKLFQG